jgi:predicted transcriptional regulator
MTHMDKARAAWGNPPPDWVAALASACDESSQNRVAKSVGYSAGAISQILAGKYGARTDVMEEVVRRVLMKEEVECPVLYTISMADCRRWRGIARSGAILSRLQARVTSHCLRCPRNREAGHGDA